MARLVSLNEKRGVVRGWPLLVVEEGSKPDPPISV